MKDLKPAFRFLGVFVGLYLGLNIVYGLWISSHGSHVDEATELVTNQTSFLLNVFGEGTYTKEKISEPAISVLNNSGVVMSVYEGCNGINILIVFVSFLFAFGGSAKSMAWFIPVGVFFIHLANLLRVMLLFFIAEYQSQFFYYAHKYVLTAFLYLIVFILWWYWIERVSGISIKKIVVGK